MSAFKGTPGPWLVCPTNSGTFVKSEQVAGYLAEVRHCRTTQDVNADARLIAAAPDLLEVLEHVRDAMEASGGWDGDEHVFELVVTAIEKATGGAA